MKMNGLVSRRVGRSLLELTRLVDRRLHGRRHHRRIGQLQISTNPLSPQRPSPPHQPPTRIQNAPSPHHHRVPPGTPRRRRPGRRPWRDANGPRDHDDEDGDKHLHSDTFRPATTRQPTHQNTYRLPHPHPLAPTRAHLCPPAPTNAHPRPPRPSHVPPTPHPHPHVAHPCPPRRPPMPNPHPTHAPPV